MDRSDVSSLNREAWNEAAPVHAETQFARLLDAFRRPGIVYIPPFRRQPLEAHGVKGRDVIQLCCNNGREALSMMNLGARRSVGVDLSDEFIAQGERLRAVSKLNAELLRADVYELPEELFGAFDIVYITPGSLRCLPDLPGFFAVARKLLRAGGWLFMSEMHPFMNMFSMEPSKPPKPFAHPYFSRDAFISRSGLDYYRVKPYEAKPSVRFSHTLGDFVTSIARAGFIIEGLVEFPLDLSGGTFSELMGKGIPGGLNLTAHKPD